MFDIAKLPCGLRVVGEKLTHVRSCSVGVFVNVGSMNETPAENGLSHFIEHMVFKGTARRSARDIAEEMDMVGGQMNAYTSKSCTCYYAKVTDDELELAVDMLSDLALHPAFDSAELDKERGVVLEEIAMTEDEPDDLVGEVLNDVQFSGSLRYPILGPAEKIRTYSREDLLRYWSTHYTAGNMVLAISGNYDWDEFLKLAEKYFDVFPGEAPAETPFVPQLFVPGRGCRVKDVEQVHICLGFPGVESGSPDAYPISVLSNAIGGGMSSRLIQRIREELGMAYSVYSYASGHHGVGTFQVYAGTSPENAATVIDELQDQLRIFLRDGMSEKEFRSAKAQLRGGFLLGLESSSGRMQSLGRNWLILNRCRSNEEVLANIDAVTMDDVMNMARRTLCSPFSAAVVGRRADEFLKQMEGKQIG